MMEITYRRPDGTIVIGFAHYSYRRGPVGEWVFDGKPLADLDGDVISTAVMRVEATKQTTCGRAAYEADVKKRPTYHDGSPRKTWDQLGTVEQWSWERAPKE
jgi:hypothetical protein